MELFKNIRFYVLSFSILLSILIYVQTIQTIPEVTLQTASLIQYYALIAVTFLYLTLLATPLTRIFTFLPFRGQYIKARRALGVSAFYFGLLHACLVFFGPMGGFTGLFSLRGKYLLAAILGITTLAILTLMASTAFDFMIDRLGFKRWKFLHRFVYLASISILFHALIFGSHFQDLSGIIPKIFLIALVLLIILEIKRFYIYLKNNN